MEGWFGKKKRSKEIIKEIIAKLGMQRAADVQDEDIKRKNSAETEAATEGSVGADIDRLHVKVGAKAKTNEREEVERSF